MALSPQANHSMKSSKALFLQVPHCVGHFAFADFHHKGALSRSGSGSDVSTMIPSLDGELSNGGACSTRKSADFASLDTVGCSAVAPDGLHTAFDPAQIQPWEPERFEMLGKVQDATRNRGVVHHMLDSSDQRHVAVKTMPNDWICSCHDDFVKQHPEETEQPWQDIGCISFLNCVGYAYGCRLLGVYRDAQFTRVVTELASHGDLFSWSSRAQIPPPGPEREALMLPVAMQILEALKRLHETSIVHGDVSMENILLSSTSHEAGLQVQIIDFGMASTGRRFRSGARGKASYQAPEMHVQDEYDGFSSDAFAAGVTLYAAFVNDYPWLSTRPGACKCFEYVRKHGFRAYLQKRKIRNSGRAVAEHLSEPVVQLLEGLLALEPAHRLTLGESVWADRLSVWERL